MSSFQDQIKLLMIILVTLLFTGCEDTIESPLTGTLSGRVFDNENLMPLGGIRISTNPYSDVVETDSMGNFTIHDIKEGEYNVIASKGGYKSESVTITVFFQETTEVELVLEKSPEDDKSPVFTDKFHPAHQTVIDELFVEFAWQTKHSDSVSYDLVLFDNSTINDPIIYKDLSDTLLRVEGLKFSADYFWQLIAHDGDQSIYTEVRRFRTPSFPDNRILYSAMSDESLQLFVGDSLKENSVKMTFDRHHSWNARVNKQKTAIAFQSSRDVESHLYVMNLDGTDVQRLTNFRIGGFFHQRIEYDWAPNGGHIIFSSYDNLYRVNIDGSGLKTIAKAPENKNFREVVYSPDGSKIFVMVVGSNVLDRQIYQMDKNGANLALIYEDPGYALAHLDVSPAGKHLLFSKDVSGHESTTGRLLDAQIFELNISGGELRNLSQRKEAGTNDIQAVYSTDGGRIVFVNSRNTISATPSIWTMKINSEYRREIIQGGMMPCWVD